MRVVVSALLTTAFLVHLVQGISPCQNGATFDDEINECNCTAYYHGRLCELSFLAWDPCANWSSVPVLRDRKAVHRLGKSELCEDSQDDQCIDFSAIEPGWYRVVSPAGNYLITRCPTGDSDCSSGSPYFLKDEVAEDNANRILSRARATRYRPNLSSGCYLRRDPIYPVRILKCSAALTLYYLQPLFGITAHYCIGDKNRCSGGQKSIDGTGFEPCIGTECLPRIVDNPMAPALQLNYSRQSNGRYNASFYCNVFPVFETNGTDSDGVRYLIEFELTYRNGTYVTIPRCRWTDEAINAGHNKIFRCLSEEILTWRSNLFGGSLFCLVQARCNTAGSQFNSVRIPSSNSHGFFFSHWFENGTDVIKPGEPVSLCISSKNIPVLEEVTFYISVGRQQLIPNDKTDIAVVRRDGNESLSCGFRMMNRIYREKQICQEIALYNHDPENRVTLGLKRAEQISVIKVSISFESTADGLNTVFSNGSSFRQRIQNIDLKVDLSRLQTEVKTYFHAYTDRWIKPADSPYSRAGTFQITASASGEHFVILKHQMLPYEIQGKVQGNFFTEIAIRYVNYVIHINGSSPSGSLGYVVHHKQLPRGELSPLRVKTDGLPFGVTLETTGHVIKVRFDLYGTLLYVWGFRTNPIDRWGTSKTQCAGHFVMSNGNMNNTGYSGNPLLFEDRIALDLMLVPGFYDSANHVSGLLYGRDRVPISDPREVLLSHQYQMKSIRALNSRMQPTEVLSMCTCIGKSVTIDNCFVSLNKTRREWRSAEAFNPPLRLMPTASSSGLQPQISTSRNISTQEADEFCRKFVQLQLSKSISTEICSATKDPTGQADYVSQFKLICAQHAATRGTYDFSQCLFNSMIGMCYTDMTYNATVVRGKSTQIMLLQENICPAKCSGRGSCMNGECNCDAGFWGTSCELEIAQRDQMPVKISLLQRNVFCSSDSCSAAYLLVKPFLKSADSACKIQMNSSFNYTVKSVPVSGDIVMCELKEQHEWLINEAKMYSTLRIAVTAGTWESNNTVSLLLHQAKCQGRPVMCNEAAMTCQVGSRQGGDSGGGGGRCPRSADSAADDLNICLPSSGSTTQAPTLWIASPVAILLMELMSK